MNYLNEFLIVAGVHFLAVMSPGPDFVLTVRNALVYSRRSGLFTALGLSLGMVVHIAYCLLGIGLLISKSIVLFSVIKLFGAGYLIFLGVKSLRSKSSIANIDASRSVNEDMSKFIVIKQGFLTNVLNPKVTLFLLALFTQVISPETPRFVQALYGLEMIGMTMLWFGFVAFVISVGAVRAKFQRVQKFAEKTIGVVLIVLGVKVALSNQK
ncbi:MAG: LysE family transporter [Patescibacteria group bacterium]